MGYGSDDDGEVMRDVAQGAYLHCGLRPCLGYR